MGDPNPSQEEITPVYLAMLCKAAKSYHNEKYERKSSSHKDATSLSLPDNILSR
jgi:hypothetical protein